MERKIMNESTIPANVYAVEKNYIDFLRKRDENVIDPQITQRYYGPVLTVERDGKEIDYFAPILPDETLKSASLTHLINGVFCEIDLRHMIPCSEKSLSTGEYNAERTQFFMTNHDLIKAYALETYRDITNS